MRCNSQWQAKKKPREKERERESTWREEHKYIREPSHLDERKFLDTLN